jgi:hypothetical protein
MRIPFIASMLNSSCPHWLATPSQQQLYLAQRFSVYNPSMDRLENTVFKNAPNCCIHIYCHRNMFIEPLPHNRQWSHATIYLNKLYFNSYLLHSYLFGAMQHLLNRLLTFLLHLQDCWVILQITWYVTVTTMYANTLQMKYFVSVAIPVWLWWWHFSFMFLYLRMEWVNIHGLFSVSH